MVGELQSGDPRSVGPYRLLGRLGSGGMGQVFLGRSAGGRLVAVKVIRPDLAGEPGFRARFAREVGAARNVSGLFTALVVDADVEGPMPWLATAYVPGPSLSEAVASQGPLPVDSVLALAAGLAEGLEAIHAAGVVHRDLKPSNVLLADDGPRVIDFGISRAAESTMLTQSGTVIGSPGFMSPEQATAGEIGPPSDVFSLGAVLTFAATGEGPFGTGSIPAMIYRVVHTPPDTASLPARIRPVIERCLAKEPRDRPTPGDLLAELGAGQLAADWLPPPLTEVVSRYASPGLAAAASLGTDSPLSAGLPGGAPPPASIPAAPPTTTGMSTPTPPSRPAAQTQPSSAADASGTDASGTGGGGIGSTTAGPTQPRSRRRLAWVAGAAAVIIAASTSAALAVSSHGGQGRGTTGPSQRPGASAPASAHPTRSSSPTVSPTAATSSFAQGQPTAGQYSPAPTPTTTPTTSPTPTTTTTPTSSPTPTTTTTSLPTSSPTP
ncbi:MAG TPA: protein kinase [Streptosporangiaceae bacterium]|nr:protein kinase [Streptosporangiaceae bacterium]